MLNLNILYSQKKCFFIWLASFFVLFSSHAYAEWNADWAARKKISINAQGLSEPVSNAQVVVRLHSGNFDFTSVNVDGSDLRFVAQDDKTELKYYIEKFDAVNELAIIWVQVPTINALVKDAHFWLYYSNENAISNSSDKSISDASTVALFHFADKGLLLDSSNTGLQATGSVTTQKAGLVGESASFNASPINISENSAINPGATYTWSAWVKPASLPQTSNLFNQKDGIVFGIDAQKLILKIGDALMTGGELKPSVWQHVAFTIAGGKAKLYLDGAEVTTGDIPTLSGIGGIAIGENYIGEMDELEIANVPRSASWLKLTALSQGVDSKLLNIAAGEGEEGEEEGEGEANYIGILINSLTLDAKIVIGILAVMFAISVWVMWSKFALVSKTDKDNKKFLARFQKAGTTDLLQLDKGANYKDSNLYMLYMAGLREIRKREHEGGQLSLSGASMDAIKAAIDADLVRETQRQNAGIVLLTIAISGGPFLGLLGTVVGVMITFAAIAAAGDVNVNAIAPGIAAALLATVAGLGVAIPALFGYNYLASRIKNITIAMQIFVDEFVTRTAELYGKE